MVRKVLLLGLDSVNFDIIGDWLAGGFLPNLKKLIEGGASGDLYSTLPPVSPCAWTTIATGKNPGKHGLFDFEKRGEDYESGIVTSNDIKEERIWGIVNKYGRTAGIFNYMYTYPPKKIKGYIVSDFFLTPSQTKIYAAPQKIAQELEDVGYILKEKEKYLPGKEDLVFDDLRKKIISNEKAVLHLLEKHDCDLNMYIFLELDRAHHRLWKFMDREYPCSEEERKQHGDKIRRLYQQMDELVGKVIAKAGDRDIIIISDHGAGPLYDIFFINKWLIKEGLLVIKKDARTQLKIFLARHNVLFNGYKMIAKLGLRNIFLHVPLAKKKKLINSLLSLEDVDWSKTKAYAKGEFNQIYINLKGRERKGIVNSGKEYERLRNAITVSLGDLKDSAGKKLVTKVYKKEELYHGCLEKYAPDLIFDMQNNKYISSHHFGFEVNSLFGGLKMINNTGTHRQKGIFIINGKGITKKKGLSASVIDIAPTILYMMGLPIPGDMDGQALKDIFDPQSRPIQRTVKMRKKTRGSIEKERLNEVIVNLNLDEHDQF